MINELQFEIQKQVYIQYKVQLSIDNSGQFYCREAIEDALKSEIMAFVSGYSSGYINGRTLVPADPKNNFQELRFSVANALNEDVSSPLKDRLTKSQIASIAYNLRGFVAHHDMNHSLYFTLQNLFTAIASCVEGKWDVYMGKHNGFKALFERLPHFLSEDNSFDAFKRIFDQIHFEKTVIASQSLFHTERLRGVLKKIS